MAPDEVYEMCFTGETRKLFQPQTKEPREDQHYALELLE